MHRSRLGGLSIDCRTDDLEGAVRFWSAALGLPARKHTDPADANYIRLETAPNDLHAEVQKVDHPSRVHLDIETDDIDAEVARLEKLGARPVQRVKGWYVMEAPMGQRFCVVRIQRTNFATEANVWE